MEDKRISFGYEDTDKKIEIELYGLIFEIRNFESIEKLSSMDKNSKNAVEEYIENILGEGSIAKINRKRASDGYKELDLDIELNILACIMEAYTKVTANNFLGRVTRAVEEIDQSTKNKLTQNREMRRNYNKNNRRNKYRRY